jgi:cation:H+ antiporter
VRTSWSTAGTGVTSASSIASSRRDLQAVPPPCWSRSIGSADAACASPQRLAASELAVSYTRALAAGLGAPPFVVGVVLVAVGTDLPEIANSIASHLQGEGDVNVGDSVGSTLTQYTFVLGLFPFVAGALVISRRQVGLVTVLTTAGLGLATLFVLDGRLARLEGVALIAAWGAATVATTKLLTAGAGDDPPGVRHDGKLAQTLVALGALGLVGAGATVAVHSLVRLAETLGVPEFLLAFFGASVGTSMPEVLVDVTALRRGAPGIALGDALGSSLVDSTLSIGAGPAVAPADVTTRLAVVGTLYTLAAVAIVGAILALRRRHDRLSAFMLIALYALSYAVLLGPGR